MPTLIGSPLLLIKGVEPSQISVLVYYTGQLSLVAHKIETTAQVNGKTWDFTEGNHLSSVDSFQGEGNEFIDIDIVTAHREFSNSRKGKAAKGTEAEPEDSEGEDGGKEAFKRSGKVTVHVKNPNRLCCALTRGKSCVVVICQLEALLSTIKASQTKSNAALGAMARDFVDRKLVFHDYRSLDTSPVAEETRAKWDKATQDDVLRQRRLEGLELLNTVMQKGAKTRYAAEFHGNAPQVYRTANRRTTRPNIPSTATEDADTHDMKSKRNRSAFTTKAGTVPVSTSGKTQRGDKEGRHAEQAKKAWQIETERRGTIFD